MRMQDPFVVPPIRTSLHCQSGSHIPIQAAVPNSHLPTELYTLTPSVQYLTDPTAYIRILVYICPCRNILSHH